MKKIAVFVVLVCLSVGFWYVDSHRFQEEVKQFLEAHQIKYTSLSLQGTPLSYNVVVAVPSEKEKIEGAEVHLNFEEPLLFSKGIFSRKISVQTKVKGTISSTHQSELPNIFSSGMNFSTKIFIKDLKTVEALAQLSNAPEVALENPLVKNFASEIVFEDFVCTLVHHEESPVFSWDKLVLSFHKDSAVGGVFRAEANLDLQGFAYGEAFWKVASSFLSDVKEHYPQGEKLLAMIEISYEGKQNATLRLGFTAPEDVWVGADFKVSKELANPTLATSSLEKNYTELFAKIIDAEIVVHGDNDLATGDLEVKFDSVIIDEHTKQMGYDFHYKSHFTDEYWKKMDKTMDIAATIQNDHESENYPEMMFLPTFAKTWKHFNPRWKDFSVDYGFITDVDRKTMQMKSMALKQLALKVDDMSLSVGIDNQMIDFSRSGLVGDEKIPVTIKQYQRLLGGIVDFGLKWVEEARKNKSFNMPVTELPGPNFTQNFLNLVKEISDEPQSDATDVTITVLMSDDGPKKVGTLSLMQVMQKFFQFHEQSFVPAIPPATPPAATKPHP